MPPFKKGKKAIGREGGSKGATPRKDTADSGEQLAATRGRKARGGRRVVPESSDDESQTGRGPSVAAAKSASGKESKEGDSEGKGPSGKPLRTEIVVIDEESTEDLADIEDVLADRPRIETPEEVDTEDIPDGAHGIDASEFARGASAGPSAPAAGFFGGQPRFGSTALEESARGEVTPQRRQRDEADSEDGRLAKRRRADSVVIRERGLSFPPFSRELELARLRRLVTDHQQCLDEIRLMERKAEGLKELAEESLAKLRAVGGLDIERDGM